MVNNNIKLWSMSISLPKGQHDSPYTHMYKCMVHDAPSFHLPSAIGFESWMILDPGVGVGVCNVKCGFGFRLYVA
jgi:hypothetical protein